MKSRDQFSLAITHRSVLKNWSCLSGSTRIIMNGNWYFGIQWCLKSGENISTTEMLIDFHKQLCYMKIIFLLSQDSWAAENFSGSSGENFALKYILFLLNVHQIRH